MLINTDMVSLVPHSALTSGKKVDINVEFRTQNVSVDLGQFFNSVSGYINYFTVLSFLHIIMYKVSAFMNVSLLV